MTRNGRRLLVMLLTIGVAGVAALLRWLPPELYSFYPRCPIRALFGIDCPGCGGTRAVAALLHGNLTQALHYNALTTTLLPFIAAYACTCAYRAWTFTAPPPLFRS